MSEKWAIAAGNWSNPAIWNDGIVPGSSNVVHAGGFTIVIDQDITVAELTTAAGVSAPSGGTFQANVNNLGARIVNANVRGGTSLVLTVQRGSVLNGNIAGSLTTSQFAVSATINAIVNGDVTPGGITNAHGLSLSNSVFTGNVVPNTIGGINRLGIELASSVAFCGTIGTASGMAAGIRMSGGICFGHATSSGAVQLNGNNPLFCGEITSATNAPVLINSNGIVIPTKINRVSTNAIRFGATGDGYVILPSGVFASDVSVTAGGRYTILDETNPLAALILKVARNPRIASPQLFGGLG
jgi:hypothetical protein